MTTSRGNFNRPAQLSPVRVVATGNISGTYSNGPTNDGVAATLTTTSGTLTIDSVTVVQNESVLLSGQSSALQNGIYFHNGVNASGNVVLQRRDDFQSRQQILAGYYVPVAAGTLQKGTIWTVVEPSPVNIGTDSISFVGISPSPDVALPTIANHIATYSNTTGALAEDPATAISGGNIQAGLSGTAGSLVSFPGTAASGSLALTAANSAGNFANVITNASMGQATTWTLGDPGAAASKILQASGALTTNHLLAATGTAGNVVDTGFVFPAADASANADATAIAVPASSNGSGTLSFANTLPRMARGNISLANFNTLFTTPIELIPAPGANLMVVVLQFGVEWVFGSAAPTAGGALYLQYGNTAHGTNFATPSAGIPAAFFTGLAASSAISALGQINSTTGLATSVCGNAAITVTVGTQNFATGTGGSLNWYVWYQIVPIN